MSCAGSKFYCTVDDFFSDDDIRHNDGTGAYIGTSSKLSCGTVPSSGIHIFLEGKVKNFGGNFGLKSTVPRYFIEQGAFI